MDGCQSRFKRSDGSVQQPIAMLTCNFAKTVDPQRPDTLTHDDVVTLFHEMGHCLHHLLTTVDYLSASGTHGVEWDAVELPSQFFEHWAWNEQALSLLSAHIDSGETLPAETAQQLIVCQRFQAAMALMRQLEFSLFDVQSHQKDPQSMPLVLETVRQKTSVVPRVAYNRFQNSFCHVFAGGYAAGYYSYQWAEVLSSDAFARFEEEGVFNPQTGRDFLRNVLEVGGSCSALQAFVKVRGREPRVEALLRHLGIHSGEQTACH